MRVEARAFALVLARPLVTGAGTRKTRTGWVVRIGTASGVWGHGEASPLPGHGPEDPARVWPALVALSRALADAWPAGRGGAPQGDEWRRLAQAVAPGAPAARAAFDLALTDLAAARGGGPMASWLAAAATTSVAVNGLIGVMDPRPAAEEAHRLVAEGYETLKVKVGGDVAADMARLAAVRAAVGRGVALRADANGAWDEEAATAFVGAAQSLDLEFLEQPVAAENVAALARLRGRGAVPVAADETLLTPGGAGRVLAMKAADVVVLKPSLLGGPTEALALARQAQDEGIAAVVTSALESAVGRLGALHLAAAIPGGRAHGLATGGRFEEDLAPFPVVVAGRIEVPSGPGLGLTAPLAGPWVPLAPDVEGTHASPGGSGDPP